MLRTVIAVIRLVWVNAILTVSMAEGEKGGPAVGPEDFAHAWSPLRNPCFGFLAFLDQRRTNGAFGMYVPMYVRFSTTQMVNMRVQH